MKMLFGISALLMATLVYGQGFVPRSVPLFKSQPSLSTYSSRGYHYYKPSETPYDHTAPAQAYCTTGNQPMFCAFETKLSKTFKFPVKVRLDDRKYDFR